jgi:transposase
MTKEQAEVITSVQRCRRWSRAEKERIVAAAMEPGAISSEVARRTGIHASQLFRWRRQLCERTQIPRVFNPVMVTPEAGALPSPLMERTGPSSLDRPGLIEIEFRAPWSPQRQAGEADVSVARTSRTVAVERDVCVAIIFEYCSRMKISKCEGGTRGAVAGQPRPRQSKAPATGVHPITDTKAIRLRDRYGPISSSRVAANVMTPHKQKDRLAAVSPKYDR